MVKDDILNYAVGEVEKWAKAVCIAKNEELRTIAVKALNRALKHYELVVRLVGENPLLKQQTC
jgi:siroheme synthase